MRCESGFAGLHVSGGCGSKAQRRPSVVDGNLPDRLYAFAGEDLGEPVTVEVGAELAAFGVADPGQAVGASGTNDGGELVEVVTMDSEADHRSGGGRLAACGARGQGHARRGVEDGQ